MAVFKNMLQRGWLLAIGGLLFAQEPIRVNTRLVQVNVVVHDAHGPVAGLTKDDFKIFDKGKERKIAAFSAADARLNASPNLAVAARPQQEPQHLPEGVVTNRPESAKEKAVSATVLLIDALNTDFKDQQAARKQVLKFIASMDGSRPMAIYLLTTRIRVLQDFTDDPSLLRRAAAKFQGESSALLRGANEPTPYSDDAQMASDPTIAIMRESFNELRDAQQIDRAQATANALQQIAARLSSVAGRKTLVWLSSAFPFYLINDERGNFLAANREERTFQGEVNRAVLALSAADVAIYPVDARGIDAMPMFNPSDPHSDPAWVLGNSSTFGKRGNGQLGTIGVDRPEGFETMADLAAGTGGRAFYNTNDFSGAIRAALEDADVSYTLGFYVSDPPDETFHSLKVKVDRTGADVRHRSGYFFGTDKPPVEQDREAIIHDAAASALDSTKVGLMAQAERESDGLHLAVKIDMNDLALTENGGKWTGGAEIAFVGLAADGTTTGIASKTVDFNMTNEAYLARKRDGLILEQTMAADPKLAKIRVVVLDFQSSAVGSLTIKPPVISAAQASTKDRQ